MPSIDADIGSFLSSELGVELATKEDRESTAMALNTIGRILLFRSRRMANELKALCHLSGADGDDDDESDEDDYGEEEDYHVRKLKLLNQSIVCFEMSSNLSGFGNETPAPTTTTRRKNEDLMIAETDDLETVERKMLESHERKKMNRRTSHQKSILSRSTNWVVYGALSYATALQIRGCFAKSGGEEDLKRSANLANAILSFINVQKQISSNIDFDFVKLTALGLVNQIQQQTNGANQQQLTIVPTGKLTTANPNR